jgi:hypothetical protein
LFCDPDRTAATELGILDSSSKNAKGLPGTVRSVFVLKPDKTIALMMTYPASTGRHFDEILRVVNSVQLTATSSVATSVNWQKAEDVIVNFSLTDAAADEKFGKEMQDQCWVTLLKMQTLRARKQRNILSLIPARHPLLPRHLVCHLRLHQAPLVPMLELSLMTQITHHSTAASIHLLRWGVVLAEIWWF